jgi:hypothetical protein
MSGYDLRLHLTENMLLIKVVDGDYNIYKTGITKQHQFVQQFLNENLKALHEFLENRDNIEIIEEMNCMRVILHKPVHLEFNLTRQQQEGFENDIRKELVSKFGLLVNLEKRLSSIEKQLSYGVILPGYPSVLPVDLETLYINFVVQYQPKNYPTETLVDNNAFKLVQNDVHCKTSTNNETSHSHEVYLGKRLNPYWFDGHTLEPVGYLKGLKRLFLRHIEDKVTDISPIYHCSELEVLRIQGFANLKTINFAQWPKLKLVVLHNLPNLVDIKSLENIDIDELCIDGCAKLLNMPNLASKVKIEKK